MHTPWLMKQNSTVEPCAHVRAVDAGRQRQIRSCFTEAAYPTREGSRLQVEARLGCETIIADTPPVSSNEYTPHINGMPEPVLPFQKLTAGTSLLWPGNPTTPGPDGQRRKLNAVWKK